jgi:hypothetical protein
MRSDGRGIERAGSRGYEWVAFLRCVECRTPSDLNARGWRGYRVDDPDEDEPPALAFYCPTCARREFD